MLNPLISVIMPVYNGQPYLSAAVDSVLAQTLTDFEFVIVDDGSVDETADMLERYAGRDDRVKILSLRQNIGLTRALNLGLGLARGEYVARQDADDISLPPRLAVQAALLRQEPKLGLVGAIPDLISSSGALLSRERRFGLTNQILQRQLLQDCCFCHGSVMVRRQWLETVGAYDPDMEPAEDYDLWLRLAEVTEVANIDEPLYQFRQHPSSVSQQRQALQIERAGLALERAAFRRHGPNPPPGSLEIAAAYYLRAAISAHLAANSALAQPSLARAIRLCPTLLDQAEPLWHLLADQTSGRTVEVSLAINQAIFEDLLPATPRLRRLRRQAEARLHMQEVFASWDRRDFQYIWPHLWAGIAINPHWLLNRGVLRYLFASWR